MKPKKQTQINIQIQKSSSSDGDCTCELLDDSLSKISDADCQCSECQEARLEAFNQISSYDENIAKQNVNQNNRGQSIRVLPKSYRGVSKNTIKKQNNKNDINNKLTRYQSAGKLKQNNLINSQEKPSFSKEQQKIHQQDDSFPKFSRESINDYIAITQHRAKKYLRQLKGTKTNIQIQRQKMQQSIKQKLYILKNFNLRQKKKHNSLQKDESRKSPSNLNGYKWNHKPYICKCNSLVLHNQQKQKNAVGPSQAIEAKDFQQKRKQAIEKTKKRIRDFKEKNKQKKYQCPDKCPHHHLRTSKAKIKQIQKFILKKAAEIRKHQITKKIEEDQKLKIKEAKLRAIDLRSKQILAKSKKYNPQQQKTSFHNSVDHFSTFSQLRQNKEQRVNQKKKQKQMKKGANLQNAIYKDLQQDIIGAYHQIQQKKDVQKDKRETPQKQQWCEKIVKQARIRPPKQIKQQDKHKKIKKQQQKQAKDAKESYRDRMAKDFKRQDKKRKQLQDQIARKKEEILREFRKRNSNNPADSNKHEPKNKELREQYEQKFKYRQSPVYPNQNSNKKQQKYDPYRQVYKNQPTKNPNQLKIVGDPLLQQYEYQRNKKIAQSHSNRLPNEIFTNSAGTLMIKKQLKV